MKVPVSWFKIFITRSTFLSNGFHKQNAKTVATNDPSTQHHSEHCFETFTLNKAQQLTIFFQFTAYGSQLTGL